MGSDTPFKAIKRALDKEDGEGDAVRRKDAPLGRPAPDAAGEVVMEDNDSMIDPLAEDGFRPKESAGVAVGAAGKSQAPGAAMAPGGRARRVLEDPLDWDNLGKEVLATYTTRKDIPISSKVIDNEEEVEEVVTLTERAKRRLAGLEEEEEAGGAVKMMTQKELIDHLESLAKDLEKAWNNGEKVKSLRIVIQSCKMLVACKVPAIYPSFFVLSSKVLDAFGRLVFERIKKRSEVEEKGGKQVQVQNLDTNFRASDIPDEAKEMCKNWFFKIASIRELVPRLYVEMSLWSCNRFLVDRQANQEHYTELIRRFAWQIRGIGDPLVANYARTYLLRKAMEVFDGQPPLQYCTQCFDDWMQTRQQFEGLEPWMQTFGLEMKEYKHLYTPSLHYCLGTIGKQGDEEVFKTVLKSYLDSNNESQTLACIIASFSPQIVSKYSEKLVAMIEESEEGVYSKSTCYSTLGLQVARHAPTEKKRVKLLGGVWGQVTEIQDPLAYIPVAAIWLEFVVKHCKEREVGVLLSDIQSHIGLDKSADGIEEYVEMIVNILTTHTPEFNQLFQYDQFLPLVDLLPMAPKADLCKDIMTKFAARNEGVNDAIIINSLLEVARTMHDTLTETSNIDEKRQVTYLITTFMGRCDFGRDLDGQLSFFVDCRRSFNKLDSVMEAACYGVVRLITLALKTTTIRSHSKKAAAFVKACLAFLHITIPSLDDHLKRLRLFLASSMVALAAGFVSQSNVLMETCMNTLRDVPAVITMPNNMVMSTGDSLASFMSHFAGCLVAMPSSVDEKPTQLIEDLLEFTLNHDWEDANLQKPKVLMRLCQCVSALAQNRLPYHFKSGTASNDTLFVGNSKYGTMMQKLAQQIFNEVIQSLDDLSNRGQGNKVGQLAGEILETYKIVAEVDEKTVARLKALGARDL